MQQLENMLVSRATKVARGSTYYYAVENRVV
jgi:hypothetical protein